jgi:hypothetical protein
MKFRSIQRTGWTRIFPPLMWLAEYKPSWLRHDAIAGVTLAAYAIPVSLAYRDLLSTRNGRLDRERLSALRGSSPKPR